jgi:hypothetical protein
LSARSETAGAEPFKFGEPPGSSPRCCAKRVAQCRGNAEPSPSRVAMTMRVAEGVETRRGAPNAARQIQTAGRDGEGIVQRTNGDDVVVIVGI